MLFPLEDIVFLIQESIAFFPHRMVINQRRQEAQRNACLPCYTHKDYTPNSLSTKDISRTVFKHYARLITKPVSKAVVIILTLGITGVAIWGNVLLEQKFDVTWFLPPGNIPFWCEPIKNLKFPL